VAWQLRQHQETVARLYSITTAALCSSSSGLVEEEQQQEEQQVAVCDCEVDGSHHRRQQQQQQTTEQQGYDLSMKSGVDSVTLCGHAAAGVATAGAASAWSTDDAAWAGAGRGAGVSDQAAAMEGMSCAVTADFSDCQDLLTVMAALLE
jgi:hypothetical protein